MMPCDTHSPRPVPLPGFVEKNGSEICAMTSSGMPLPVSRTWVLATPRRAAPVLQQAGGFLHRLERVVDLVRDRRREPSGRRELLRVEEHLLEPATLELAEPPDVLHDRDGRDDRAPRVAHLGRLDLHLEAFLTLGIGHHDLAPPLAGGLEPERCAERAEPGVICDGDLV